MPGGEGEAAARAGRGEEWGEPEPRAPTAGGIWLLKGRRQIEYVLGEKQPLPLSHSPQHTQISPRSQQVSGPSRTGSYAGVTAVCRGESWSLFELVGNLDLPLPTFFNIYVYILN